MLRVLLLAMLARLSTGAFDPELHAKYLQLPRDEFIQYFNSQNYSWKITHHPHLATYNLACAKTTSGPIPRAKRIHHDPTTFADLPDNFDAREKWPNCTTIKEIYDQGVCGSCWTFGVATVASDRTCIHRGLNVRLSEQDFTCFYGNLCDGGYSMFAFIYWLGDGLVTQECSPYNVTAARLGSCDKKCQDPNINYSDDKHKGESIYFWDTSIDNVSKAELFYNGSVQTSFSVYQDFKDYKSGIYEHKYGDNLGMHSVRVIGYGEDDGVEYWLVANSWGTAWGDKGFFKVKRHQPELSFEVGFMSGMPKN